MNKEGTTKPGRSTFMKALSRSLIVVGAALFLFGVGSWFSFLEPNPNQNSLSSEGDPRGYVEWQRECRFLLSGVLFFSIGFYLRGKWRKSQAQAVGPDSGNPK